MLWNASAIKGYAIQATDGRLGTVSDLLFDDSTWLVRWLVVETGTWLSNRKVLLPTLVLGHPNEKGHEFSVRLTKQQVKDSPDISTERPVSRQMETELFDYYGWTPYWGTGFYTGGYGYMPGGYGLGTRLSSRRMGSRQSGVEREIAARERDHDDPHLRSAAAVTGYHIGASDGEVGHVEDFLVADADWSIHYLVVDTKNWWPGKKVLISPGSARDVDWSNKLVHLDVDRQTVKDSPAYDGSTAIDRAYENHFHKYYGAVRPSERPRP
jgi:hypothetical protein